MKVHTMFVIGKRDMDADAVSVRAREGKSWRKASFGCNRGHPNRDQRPSHALAAEATGLRRIAS
jgi:hypothetical protein